MTKRKKKEREKKKGIQKFLRNTKIQVALIGVVAGVVAAVAIVAAAIITGRYNLESARITAQREAIPVVQVESPGDEPPSPEATPLKEPASPDWTYFARLPDESRLVVTDMEGRPEFGVRNGHKIPLYSQRNLVRLAIALAVEGKTRHLPALATGMTVPAKAGSPSKDLKGPTSSPGFALCLHVVGIVA